MSCQSMCRAARSTGYKARDLQMLQLWVFFFIFPRSTGEAESHEIHSACPHAAAAAHSSWNFSTRFEDIGSMEERL